MDLQTYFRRQGRGSMTELADALKTSKGYLHEIAKGKRRPSVEMARRIETATQGKVKAIGLLGLKETA